MHEDELMKTCLRHLPISHGTMHLICPLKVLHKPLFSISLGTYVMPMGNEKKKLLCMFFMKTFLHNTTPGPKRGTGWACTNLSLPVKILEIFQLKTKK